MITKLLWSEPWGFESGNWLSCYFTTER